MLFNSASFLAFFAIVVLLHYALPTRFRWFWLLIASLYFYSTFQPKYLLLLAFSTLGAYGFARWLEAARRPRAVLSLGIVVQASTLVIFKYFDFLAGTIEWAFGAFDSIAGAIELPRLDAILPVGLSFYVFSSISYLVDVHRRVLPAERHLGKFALYIAFFPKLLAGPIERADTFLAQLKQTVSFNAASAVVGLQLVVWGLFKKVVIADRLAAFVDAGFTNAALQSPVAVLTAIYFYAFQIYCDFSGYSDIAIGAALLLGIRLMQNFRRPYLSRSVREFWGARWHLSLAHWFRDYLYIPLGGSRVGTVRRQVNVLVVFLVSGLWHGAAWNFVIWGAVNGLYQVIAQIVARPKKWLADRLRLPAFISVPVAVLVTFHLITFAWIFFRASSVNDAFAIIAQIWNALPQLPMLLRFYDWTAEFYVSVCLILLLMTVELLDERSAVSARLLRMPLALRWALYYAVLLSIVVIGVWNVDAFVYMQF